MAPRKLHRSILRSTLDVVEALLEAGADTCVLWQGCTPRQMLQGVLKEGKLGQPYRFFKRYAGQGRMHKDFGVKALKVRRGRGPICVLVVIVHILSLALIPFLA